MIKRIDDRIKFCYIMILSYGIKFKYGVGGILYKVYPAGQECRLVSEEYIEFVQKHILAKKK